MLKKIELDLQRGTAVSRETVTVEPGEDLEQTTKRAVYADCLVTLYEDPIYGTKNDVDRFKPCPAPEAAKTVTPNPFVVPLNEGETEGRAQSEPRRRITRQ